MKLVMQPKTTVQARTRPQKTFATTKAFLLPSPTALLLSLSLLLTPPALAEETAALFSRTCGACHTNGGNILGGPTLSAADLAANDANTTDAIYKIIYSGKRKMYGFGELCEPKGACTFGKRLSDTDIQSLATYVLDQSQKGWKQ